MSVYFLIKNVSQGNILGGKLCTRYTVLIYLVVGPSSKTHSGDSGVTLHTGVMTPEDQSCGSWDLSCCSGVRSHECCRRPPWRPLPPHATQRPLAPATSEASCVFCSVDGPNVRKGMTTCEGTVEVHCERIGIVLWDILFECYGNTVVESVLRKYCSSIIMQYLRSIL